MWLLKQGVQAEKKAPRGEKKGRIHSLGAENKLVASLCHLAGISQ